MAKQVIPLANLPVVSKNTIADFSSDNYSSGTAILLDKPLEWSSFDAVRYVRNRITPKKVGHAGTLDPLATGLLVICTGKATRTVSQIQDGEKEYTTTIKFGESTPSYDGAMPADDTAPWQHITLSQIELIIEENFLGTITQMPPVYSAIRVEGERLYKKARRGEKVNLPPRQVSVNSIEILDHRLPQLDLKITCEKGTYIRSIVHELGQAVDSLAYVTSLRRTRIGNFRVEDAVTPFEFDSHIKP